MLETFLFIAWVLFLIVWAIFAILTLVTHDRVDRVCLTLMRVFIIIVNILCLVIILI